VQRTIKKKKRKENRTGRPRKKKNGKKK